MCSRGGPAVMASSVSDELTWVMAVIDTGFRRRPRRPKTRLLLGRGRRGGGQVGRGWRTESQGKASEGRSLAGSFPLCAVVVKSLCGGAVQAKSFGGRLARASRFCLVSLSGWPEEVCWRGGLVRFRGVKRPISIERAEREDEEDWNM